MAEEGRRQLVSDPLTQKAGGQTPSRGMSLSGVRNANQGPGDDAYRDAMSGFAALGAIQKAVAGVAAAKKDEWVVKGKMDYMTGMSEAELLRTGNKYTQQGYEALSSVDQAGSWYQNELLAIDQTTRDMSPDQYKSYLMDRRKQTLADLPDDPAIRKLYVAAFEEYGPRLADQQFKAHNERNRTKNVNALSGAAYTSAGANEDASRVMPGGPLRVSPGIVSPRIQGSAEDRDIGIRTMLGEAGGEGEFGMAAVAHVIKNRAIDGGYGGNTIAGVSKAPKQFSAWNDGPGGIRAIHSYSPTSKAYQRAAKVYDAVMGGHHADPTGGATHYYSPGGMSLLVKEGSQKNLVPGWWGEQAAKNEVTIGNHKFAGKARGVGHYTVASGHAEERGRDLSIDPVDNPTAIASALGVPLQHTPGQSQAQQLFASSNLRDEDKAEAATDAMVRALEEGNDQVYNDLGGEGFLRSLSATDQQINAVQSARARQQKNEQDKFDVDRVRQEEDFKAAVKSGEFKTKEELLEGVETLQTQLGQDEAWAKSLANETLTAWYKHAEDDKALNPQLAADLAGIQRMMVEEPGYTAEQASADVQRLGETHGIEGKVVQDWITDMWRRDATRKDKLLADMKAEHTKAEKEALTKAQVESALKRNSGLQAIKGNVTMVDDNGHEREVSAQEYAVKLLKDREITNARQMIDAGEMDPNRADALVNKVVYEKLAKHGVVDEVHGAEIEGALKGDFSDASGKVSEDAMKAFDFWLQMKKNPNVGPEYMATMVKDPDVRTLLNTAEVMYSGRMSIDEALRKAHIRINQGVDPDVRMKLGEKFQAQVGKGVTESLDKVMSPDSFFAFNKFTDADREQVDMRRDAYREDIINRAQGYFIQNPVVDPSVHIRMATEDFQNDAVVVGGTVTLGKHSEGKRLDQVMGVETFGRDAPQQAINSYMAEFGEDLFPNLLTGPGNEERTQSWRWWAAELVWDTSPIGATVNKVLDWDKINLTRTKPAYHVDYNSADGTLAVQLWKDSERKELIGSPQIINAKELGEYWLEDKKEAPFGFGALRNLKEGVSNMFKSDSASNAGEFVGGLVKPE